MGMPAAEKVFTVEDVRRLRDEQDARATGRRMRYEVVEGELLVTPLPRAAHQRAAFAIARHLHEYVEAHRLGEVFAHPIPLDLDDINAYEPDLSVVPLVAGKRIASWDDLGPLLLVIEILSPSTARYDRGAKRARYQRAGIPEYWIVDLDARLIERWRPEDERPEVLPETITWTPAGASEPFLLALPAFFASVLGDELPEG